MDEELTALYTASEPHYRELGHGFEMPEDTVGVLVVGEDPAALEPTRADLAARFPELHAEALDAPREAEPALAQGLAGFLIHTGRTRPARRRHPGVRRPRPRRRRRALEGTAVDAGAANGRVSGVRTPTGDTEPAGAVVVAAGPWSAALVDPTGAWRPSRRSGASTSSCGSTSRRATRSRRAGSRPS